MQLEKTTQKIILRDLGDGLTLRRATVEDTRNLVIFNSQIHSDAGPEHPDERVGVWTRDLMERPHPTFEVGDFTVVEDIATGNIVSSLNLISQTWTYAGIPFGVGRPELVGTLPEYRNRGLVRAQFEVVHRWSAERGELVQAITGIPYYYRQFGYEMAVNLGGGRAGYRPQVPILKDGESEPFQIRPAIESDMAFIADLYRLASQRYLLSCLRDEALWSYELSGRSEQNINRMHLRVIESLVGEPIGYLAHSIMNWSKGTLLAASAYEIKPGVSWETVTPSVIRYLFSTGAKMAGEEGKQAGFDSFGFWLGTEHPVYDVLHERLPKIRKPYAWYIRVADLPGFTRRIQTVLEQRLAVSPYSGYSGELKLTFYRSGLRLAFDKGRLVQSEAWQPAPQGHSGDAAFPGLSFLQVLFGYRSLDELNYAYPDCWYDSDKAYGLINVLFPKVNSDVWPIA